MLVLDLLVGGAMFADDTHSTANHCLVAVTTKDFNIFDVIAGESSSLRVKRGKVMINFQIANFLKDFLF